MDLLNEYNINKPGKYIIPVPNNEGANFVSLNNTSFDTTILNTLDITAQWNTNNASNNIYSDIFVLNKIY